MLRFLVSIVFLFCSCEAFSSFEDEEDLETGRDVSNSASLELVRHPDLIETDGRFVLVRPFLKSFRWTQVRFFRRPLSASWNERSVPLLRGTDDRKELPKNILSESILSGASSLLCFGSGVRESSEAIASSWDELLKKGQVPPTHDICEGNIKEDVEDEELEPEDQSLPHLEQFYKDFEIPFYFRDDVSSSGAISGEDSIEIYRGAKKIALQFYHFARLKEEEIRGLRNTLETGKAVLEDLKKSHKTQLKLEREKAGLLDYLPYEKKKAYDSEINKNIMDIVKILGAKHLIFSSDLPIDNLIQLQNYLISDSKPQSEVTSMTRARTSFSEKVAKRKPKRGKNSKSRRTENSPSLTHESSSSPYPYSSISPISGSTRTSAYLDHFC